MKITSSYIQAANAIRGKKHRDRIVAFVESYDDVFFWRSILADFEDEKRYFEVMLPTRNSLTKGKKKVIMQMLAEGAGKYLIACVDADYDYLMQGSTYASKAMIETPYVFHTYAYAIENLQCYAPSLHNVCVMATLNDNPIFDFEEFLYAFSEIIFPLFVWNIWFYRHNNFHTLAISEFNRVTYLGKFALNKPEQSLENMRRKVENKLRELRHDNPGNKDELEALSTELQCLGVTPQNTYMYIQGHHLFDNVVMFIMDKVCRKLRSDQEADIRRKACHNLQRQNELSAYSHAQTDIAQMLRRNTAFKRSPEYKHIVADLEKFLADNF